MTMTMMNVRIDERAKTCGDEVLKAYGITASDAVRGLWDYLAKSRKLPDFLKEDEADKEEQIKRKREAAARLIGSLEGSPYARMTLEEIRDERLARYE